MAFAETFKALSDPVRREILTLLKKQRLSAGEIGNHFDMTGATISYHLSILKKAELVTETKCKNFVYYELEKHPEDKIICFDALTYAGNMETLDEAMKNPQFVFVKGDIANRDDVDKLFNEHKPDIVVNFAAESHVDRSIENPGIFLQTNVLGTQVLMDACRKYGIKRYHQVSTDEVYGDLPLDRPDMFFTEETPLHTSSPYSASKASADLLVMAYHRTYQLPVTISRCSNNYGPFHFPEKLIPLMIINALHDKKLPVYGEGINVRDWLYVKDHCSAIDFAKPGKVLLLSL